MPDGVIPGGPSFASTTTPATATPVSVPGGPGFSGHPQPPDVPCDPVGDDWRGPPGPVGATGPAGVDGTPGTSRNAARLQAQWVNASVVSDDTIWLCFDAPYAGTVDSLTYFTGNGSFAVSIQIDGMPVTGLGGVAVLSATPDTEDATGLNTFAEHAKITAVITGSTTAPAPTDALLSLAVTWS